ncbi:RES domain-containing protein [Paraburkholderia sp. BL6665CI2N2]|uniref:RES domain-containing protein n=1 Tax=Paraburkholderia sp. BL6665CI2N2 TaxID=1938806 RepID=UPI001065D364|nr:RES domain-containing protein [Paraburkholderia sp. BL6665CI2N2]TDY22576.1 RES domain-containing protein [Paraburkholderia sp. BL6665CI2N2]
MDKNEPIKSLEARKIVADINRMNLDGADYEYILGLISRLINGWPMQAITPHKDTRLYRGVVYKEKPAKKSFLGYPPKMLVRNFQRCNKPESPMFYCSVDPYAILLEIGVTSGDKVYVSKWSMIKEFWINRIAPRSDMEIENAVRDTVLTFFETKFAQPIHETYSSQYKITAAITEKLTSGGIVNGGNKSLGGLTYPSVAHPGRSENLAVRPEIVDQCLQLDYAEEWTITAVDEGGKISFNRTDFASDFTADDIKWTGKALHWTLGPGEEVTVMAEHDGWVARDKNGNIVNPG